MEKIKRTVEVEATYAVITYMPDGNTIKEQEEDSHEAAILSLLR